MKHSVEEWTIPATDLCEGMILHTVADEYVRRSRIGAWWARRRGLTLSTDRYPIVSVANFELIGEGGFPTVYVETADRPGWTWCLRPDEHVTLVR